jgi:DNA topoisomerase-1
MTALIIKAKKVPVGSRSKSGKYKKVAEGKWVRVTSPKEIPAPQNAVKVPPAWVNVQYFSDPKSKLWVKGQDSKGRDQYLYNPEHVSKSASDKFARVRAMNKKYPEMAKEIARDVSTGNERAIVLWLIATTGIRPGNTKDTKAEVEAYGAINLEGRHVVGKAGNLSLQFVGKKGVDLNIPVKDAGVARMLLKRKKEAGDDGKLFNITEKMLLTYSQSLGDGAGFQTKDFRTRLGTQIAMDAMKGKTYPSNMKEYRKMVRMVGDAVAAQLGNTRSVALSNYVNPAIFEKWRKRAEGT